MKTFRDNWVFILLGVVALWLVFMLISVQSAIMSQQSGAIPPGAGPFYALRRQIADFIAPPTLTPTATTAPVAQLVAPNTAIVLPTATDTPPPPPIATMLPPTPSDTPTVAPSATPILNPTATATIIPPPSATPTLTSSVPPTALAPSPISTTALAAPTTVERPDFRLGYVDRADGCSLVTEIVRLILVERMGLTAESIAFDNTDDLYATLAATNAQQRVDLTVCYSDPADRPYLQKHLGFVLLVGSAYRQVEGKSFLFLSNASVKTVIQRQQPCVYALVTHIRFPEADLAQPDAASWLAAHEAEVANWTTCP